jgi:hypothetical protein
MEPEKWGRYNHSGEALRLQEGRAKDDQPSLRVADEEVWSSGLRLCDQLSEGHEGGDKFIK